MNMNGGSQGYRQLLAERPGGRFSEDEVMVILQQVLSQLMQDGSGVQGSIALETLVQDADWQQARFVRSPDIVLPQAYLAPERQKTGIVTPGSDIYALGVTMVVLLTGKAPELLRNPDGTWKWEDYCLVNDRLAEVLNQAIADHPEQRYSNFWQMSAALNPTPVTPVPPTVIESPLPQSSHSDRLGAAPTSVATQLPPQSPSQFGVWQWGLIAGVAMVICGLAGFGLNRWLRANQAPLTSTPLDSLTSSPESPPASELPAEPLNPFKTAVYPQSSCGDLPPADPNAYPVRFYPVFLEKSERNLQQVRARFCRDAYPMVRKDNNQESIQVASFLSRERAELFRDFLWENVGWAEVGTVSIIYEMPESLR
jgi:serine/threonine protein kinase